jgi:hypothetical protein
MRPATDPGPGLANYSSLQTLAIYGAQSQTEQQQWGDQSGVPSPLIWSPSQMIWSDSLFVSGDVVHVELGGPAGASGSSSPGFYASG